MKSARGLFLLWFIASAIWAIGWTIHVRTNCAVIMTRQELVCRAEEIPVLAYLTGKSTFSFTAALLWGASVPLVTLVALALAIAWGRRRG